MLEEKIGGESAIILDLYTATTQVRVEWDISCQPTKSQAQSVSHRGRGHLEWRSGLDWWTEEVPLEGLAASDYFQTGVYAHPKVLRCNVQVLSFP